MFGNFSEKGWRGRIATAAVISLAVSVLFGVLGFLSSSRLDVEEEMKLILPVSFAISVFSSCFVLIAFFWHFRWHDKQIIGVLVLVSTFGLSWLIMSLI